MTHIPPMAPRRPHAAWAAATTVIASAMLVAACGGGADDTAGPAGSQDGPPLSKAAATVVASATSTTVEYGQGWSAVTPPAPELPAASAIPAVAIYVSSSGGTDPNPAPADHGSTPQKAFKTLAAAVKQLSTPVLANGQRYALLLRCGDGWREQISLTGETGKRNVNANPTAKLLIGAYGDDCGAGNLPLILAADWAGITDTQNNWRAGALPDQYDNPTVAAPVEQVFLDNQPLTKARYPNAQGGKPAYWRVKGLDTPTKDGFKLDYAAIEAADPTTVARLKAGTYPLVGALVHVRTNPWIIETGIVTAFTPSTGQVTVLAWDPETKAIAKELVDGSLVDKKFDNVVTSDAGAILEGMPWMLDAPGEWVHAGSQLSLILPTPIPAGKTLKDSLANLEVSRRDFGINVKLVDNVEIERVAFKHQAVSAIRIEQGGGHRVSGVRSDYAQQNGVQLIATTPSLPPLVEQSYITNAGSAGIMVRRTPGIKIKKNMVLGTGPANRARGTWGAITAVSGKQNEVNVGADGGLIEGNYVKNSANSGIVFYNAKGLLVQDNRVAFSCKRLTDCGGIYTVGDGPFPTGKVTEVNEARSTIANNIVFHAVSDYTGFYNTKARMQAVGIYLDETSTWVKVEGNTVSSTEVGIYLHDAFLNTVNNNTVRAVAFASFQASQTRKEPSLYGNTVSNNSFVAHRRVKGLTPSPTPNDINREILNLEADEVFAQLWTVAEGDPGVLFSTSEQSPTPNQSVNNKVLTVANGRIPVWRRSVTPDRGDHIANGGGARWAFRTDNAPVRPLSLAAWRTYAPLDEEVLAPVAYKQYDLGVVPQPGDSLVKPIFDLTGWTYAPSSFFVATPGADPAQLVAPQGAGRSVGSTPRFALTTAGPDNLYMARYTVRGGETTGAAGGTHRVFLKDSTGNNLGLWQPGLQLKPGEQVKVEQFFWGFSKTQPTRASFDDAQLWFGTVAAATPVDLFLSGVSLIKVDQSKLAFQPPMNELAFHVINLTGLAQQLESCAATRLPTCALLREDGSAVTWPLDLAPGQSLYLFRTSGSWAEL